MKKREVIKERIEKVRSIMSAENIAVYVICTGDYHMSEYAGDYFGEREYMSGFTGSAGTMVITDSESALFTDGRYFVQAEEELEGTGIKLMKMGCAGVPAVVDYCMRYIEGGRILGVDGRTVSASFGMELEEAVKLKQGLINYGFNAVEKIWNDRPEFPDSMAFLLEAGEDTSSKLKRLRDKIKEYRADLHIISTLDDICWLFNIRGADVACNPVVMSYALITPDSAVLYIDEKKLPSDVCDRLRGFGVSFKGYMDIYADISDLSDKKVLVDDKRINFFMKKLIEEQRYKNVELINRSNPTVLMKAVKNPVEIENLKQVHIEDGAAVTKFIFNIKNAVGRGDVITEADAAAYMDSLRAEIVDFVEPSFDTISAYGENAAKMHYHATKADACVLKAAGMLLVDSGGQYRRGTTDVTRTFALGETSKAMKRHFTLALKGMLALADARFIKGCTGYNLDILSRAPLWAEGIDYRCGTGHGIGYMLNVHEAPNGFRWKHNIGVNDLCVIEPGMVTSDEPGVYIEGEYGIRIENEIVCVPDYENEYGEFLKFEMLTCVPVDLELIEYSVLDEIDKIRLNRYHKWVCEKLKPYMNEEETRFLIEATREI